MLAPEIFDTTIGIECDVDEMDCRWAYECEYASETCAGQAVDQLAGWQYRCMNSEIDKSRRSGEERGGRILTNNKKLFAI